MNIRQARQLCPMPWSSIRGCRRTPKRAGPCSTCSTTRHRSWKGCRSTRHSSTSVACGAYRVAPPRSRSSCGDVLEQVGLPITVGVARTKFLAKVASGVAKPDGLLVVPPDGELAFLHPLPVERLWGVGPVTAEKLHDRAITTVGQVARLSEAVLVAWLGRASGRHLYALAHNHDPRAVQVGRRRRSIGAQRALGRSRKTPGCHRRRGRGARRSCDAPDARPIGSGAPSRFASASTTSRARRGRTRSTGRPRTPGRSSRRRENYWPRLSR